MRRPHRCAALWAALLPLAFAPLAAAPVAAAPEPGVASAAEAAAARPVVAVLPFDVRGAEPLAALERTLPQLLRARLEADGRVTVADPQQVADAVAARRAGPAAPDARGIARAVAADYAVAGSVTELAGRFSLDVRLVPAAVTAGGQSLVYTAEGEDALLDRINELAGDVLARVERRDGRGVVAVRIEGAGPLEERARSALRSEPGRPYDEAEAQADLERLRALPGVASASLETAPAAGGLALTFRVVPAEDLAPEPAGGGIPLAPPGLAGAEAEAERTVAEVLVRGNRRIEADAIRARISTRAGDPFRPRTVAADVREVYGLGFFRDVRVYSEARPDGVAVIFEVEENPVVRQVTIAGNDSIDSEKIRDALTLTTGSTLDHPLLYENRARIEALYRAQGYYLAEVDYSIEEISSDAVSIHFEVDEGDELRLRAIHFEGNEHFSDGELRSNLKTKPWRIWSHVTRFLDNSGTYSEPVFLQDLRDVEQKYMNAGFLRVEISDPEVEAGEDGLVVRVEIDEGARFRIGSVDVEGDANVDLAALRERLELEGGDIFDRSALTQDVEGLTSYYTQRGFYFASVDPRTRVSEAERLVDVVYEVEKGPLYFIRNIEVKGNTTTRDPVVRREMHLVEGELYDARAIQISRQRVEGLGFFEEVSFEPKPTDEPGLLDLDVSVVERPTGSFSFGAGFSSQDGFVLTGSLAQSNLFGRGYGVQLSADIGGRTQRYFASFADPYFLGTTFSLASTLFKTEIEFEDFEQLQEGIDLTLGHSFDERNRGRGFLRYNFANREIEQDSGVNAASAIFRELLNGKQSTSLVGVSARWDTRNDRFAPTRGSRLGAALEVAGLGGFSQFARAESTASFYLPAPGLGIFDKATFVVGGRVGYVLPFNDVSDFDTPDPDFAGPTLLAGIDTLDAIDTDLELPLTERYFLGGLGTFQLRGFKARSVGPRRPVLKRSGPFGRGDLFLPVGTVERSTFVDFGGETVRVVEAVCDDTRPGNQGDLDGECNELGDEDIDDFDDLDETDVIGGSKFVSFTVEYRFPISHELGLNGILFLDMGNAFAEDESLFDVTNWRYGTGAGVQWFSPFGPLQAFLGFPLDALPVEDTQVFEFSVGGQSF